MVRVWVRASNLSSVFFVIMSSLKNETRRGHLRRAGEIGILRWCPMALVCWTSKEQRCRSEIQFFCSSMWQVTGIRLCSIEPFA
jgi:hypothetical protein